MKSQFATSGVTVDYPTWDGSRKLPDVFTGQGVAMLSSVLNSDTAIAVNIRIIRVFTKLREYALTRKDILMQLAKLEKEVKANSRDIENIFMVLKELIEKQAAPVQRNRVGFKLPGSKKQRMVVFFLNNYQKTSQNAMGRYLAG